jgi:hypothetical protein
MPKLFFEMAGFLLTKTRAAGTIHFAVRHGCGPLGGILNAHPAIVKVSDCVATGCLLTNTLVLVVTTDI